MDTLTTYVNNTFSAVPQTPEIQKLKSEILDRMLNRYKELKSDGKNDTEITGIIISEFSNISDIVNEQLNSHNMKNNVYENNDSIIIPSDKNIKIVKALLSTFWPLVVAIYLFVSFTFGSWEISWLIFIIAVVVRNFCVSYFDLEDEKH